MFTQVHKHIQPEINSILSILSLLTYNFNIILPGIQRYSDVLNFCNKYLMFETNQFKCQLLGYDNVQTSKYLVWMTVSRQGVITKRCYLPNYQTNYAVS